MPRVDSKHLFNFRPTGVIDDDVLEFDKKMEEQMGGGGEDGEAAKVMKRMKEVLVLEDEESSKEFVTMMRSISTQMIEPMGKHPVLEKAGEEIIETDFKVPTNHDGQYDVLVHTYTPKKLLENKKKAAWIYAHGGGAVACTAAIFKPWLDLLAVDCDVVVFNVDYRLAPETKCPNNVKDFYAVIKHVVENVAELGVDPGKIAIAGDSGGGYICLGAMVLLAQNDETNLVKLAMPGIPMVDDYCFSDPAAMTKEEAKDVMTMRKIWNCIAVDMEKQKHDPLLFPGKASFEILEKMPPTIIYECEFDMFITEATRMANKLRAAGRLLEFIVIPGAKHGSAMFPNFKCFKTGSEAMKLLIEEYLHK